MKMRRSHILMHHFEEVLHKLLLKVKFIRHLQCDESKYETPSEPYFLPIIRHSFSLTYTAMFGGGFLTVLRPAGYSHLHAA